MRVPGRRGRDAAQYHAEVLGTATEPPRTARTGLGSASAAVVIVFLLLQAATRSWRRSGLILVTTTLAGVGAVLTAPAAGGLLSGQPWQPCSARSP